MDSDRADYVMPDAPSAEPSTPRSFRSQFPGSQQSPQASGCPYMHDHGSSPLSHPAMNMHPSMDPNISAHRMPPYDPVHHQHLSWATGPPPHWQYQMPAFPPFGNRSQMPDHQYYPSGHPAPLTSWAGPGPAFGSGPVPFGPPAWLQRTSAFPTMQQGRQDRELDRFLESSHSLSYRSSAVQHGSEQHLGHPEQQQEQSSQQSGTADFDRSMAPTTSRSFPTSQNPAQVPTLPPPRSVNFQSAPNIESMFPPGYARLPEPRRTTTTTTLPDGRSQVLRVDNRNDLQTGPVSTRSEAAPSAAEDLEQSRTATAESQSDTLPGSESTSDQTGEDSEGDSDEELEDPIPGSSDEARFLRQFPAGAVPYPGRTQDMNEERLRAHQLLRGAMSNKRIASKSALASLQSVDLESLPEKERMCIICYNDFGVATPEGINEAPLRLPKCQHVFGDHCIKKWFEESDSCPYCRDKVESECQIRANAQAIDSFLRSTGRLFDGRVAGAAPGSMPPAAAGSSGYSSTPNNMADWTALGTYHRPSSDETRQNQSNAPRWPGPAFDPGNLRGSAARPNSFTGPTPNRNPGPLISSARYQPMPYQMPLGNLPRLHSGYHRPVEDDSSPHRSPPRYPRRNGVNYQQSNATTASRGYADYRPEHVRVHSHDAAVQLPRLPGLEFHGRQPISSPPADQEYQHQTSGPASPVAGPVFGMPALSAGPLATSGPSMPALPQFTVPFSHSMELDRLVNQSAPIQNAWGQ